MLDIYQNPLLFNATKIVQSLKDKPLALTCLSDFSALHINECLFQCNNSINYENVKIW